MRRFKQLITLTVIASLLGAVSTARAEDNAFQTLFESAFYGAAVGGLVGAALMVFTDKPSDHYDYMGYGAAVGVMAGVAYGVAKTSRPLASVENGSVKIAMPTIIPELVESPSTRQMSVTWKADLLRGTFN